MIRFVATTNGSPGLLVVGGAIALRYRMDHYIKPKAFPA